MPPFMKMVPGGRNMRRMRMLFHRKKQNALGNCIECGAQAVTKCIQSISDPAGKLECLLGEINSADSTCKQCLCDIACRVRSSKNGKLHISNLF